MSKARLLPAILLALALGAYAAIPLQRTQTKPFRSGGYIVVRVPVGRIHIRQGSGSGIRLSYRIKPRNASFGNNSWLDGLKLYFEVDQDHARVEFDAPDNSNNKNGSIQVDLEVPAKSSIEANLGVGDIDVAGIEGDKDLNTGVGTITVGLDAKPDYRSIEASTGVGSISGGHYGNGSGFVGKALDWSGPGTYRLKAHTGVGSIHLED